MILKLAWKNIWRNSLRSGVVMSAVVTGIWALMFLLSFFQGMIESYINLAIENKTSHLQIHHPDFISDQEVHQVLKEFPIYEQNLMKTGVVNQMAPRIVMGGLVASATGSRGVMLKGIDPQRETNTTKLNTKIIEGEFLDGNKRNPIIISKGLAKKLGVKLNQHVVISFQDINANFVSGRFRIVGWYSTHNVKIDDVFAFVRRDDLINLTGLEAGSFHELAIKLNDISKVEEGQSKIQQLFPQTKVRNFKEISPDLALYTGQVRIVLLIIIIIIMIALLFGIINTMLMAVLERQKELGMLMAIGLNRFKLFFMVMAETLIICLIASPIGVLLGHLTVKGFQKTGIDMSTWSDGLAQFGMASVIYPKLDAVTYLNIIVALIITALSAGLYPSLKAIYTNPTQALRKL